MFSQTDIANIITKKTGLDLYHIALIIYNFYLRSMYTDYTLFELIKAVNDTQYVYNKRAIIDMMVANKSEYLLCKSKWNIIKNREGILSINIIDVANGDVIFCLREGSKYVKDNHTYCIKNITNCRNIIYYDNDVCVIVIDDMFEEKIYYDTEFMNIICNKNITLLV